MPTSLPKNKEANKSDLDQIHIPDPITTELCKMRHHIEQLEAKITLLENQNKND